MILRVAGRDGPEPCRPALVVLDFDGTLTDADAHAPAFHAASGRELAARLGWDEATLGREWERARSEVMALPPTAAYEVDGRGVCPAAADPYLIANSVTRRLLAAHRPDLDAAGLGAAVMEVHAAAYGRVPPPLRPETPAVLEALCATGLALRVVTNSGTRHVAGRLDALGLRRRERLVVRGEAAKFSLRPSASPDSRFESLPEAVEWPGLARPIHLRRGRYFDLLRAAWQESGAEPDSTLVVGDVFELDLAMPAALGAHVHLVTRAGTPPHEELLAGRLARGDAGPGLAAVLERAVARG